MKHPFKHLSPEGYIEHFSNYLIDSWSYSKVSTFARNEKAFEMQYVFGMYAKSSASTIAGQTYHTALEHFFKTYKEGVVLDLIDLQTKAFEYIDCLEANRWKIQKTTPTIESCVAEATKQVTAYLENFYIEKGLILDEIEEIIDVEFVGNEFLFVNGVPIPLPCSFKIDLVIKTKSGKTVIIDHKSKKSFTSEDEVRLVIGRQAITYTLGYEAATGVKIDEVWFVENKASKNKDKSPQLVSNVVEINDGTRKLYEALLYEPLKRMVEAVSNPDYVYLINDSDNLVDKAEIYDFWTRTMIAEIGDFNINDSKRELIQLRLKKIRDASIATISPNVIKAFKANADKFIQYDLSSKNMTPNEKIEHVLRSFNLITKVAHSFEGYSSNTFLLEVGAGVRVSSIYSYRLDIANALNVPNIRIPKELVVYEGKSYISLEYSKTRDKDLIFNPKDLTGYKIPIGKDNYGNVVYWDLDNHSTPHALICGATGSGKSVCVKNIIEYAKLAGVKNIVILDPKYEFLSYASGAIVENEIIAIEEKMAQLVEFMNKLVAEGKKEKTLIVFDEFADAVANARKGNELKRYGFVESGVYNNGTPKMKREVIGELNSLEENLRILLQKGRSVGIRIVAATQRASTKIITGDAKVNFPVQICFRVPKATDSQVVIDEPGAECLTGMGDGLMKSPVYNDIVRFQAYYKP